MSDTVTLELPDTVARNAHALAMRTHRTVEDVLLDWLNRAATELPIEELPDDQVLALRDMQLSSEHQEELSELLARRREGTLSDHDHMRLEELMETYRRGMVKKARAMKVAVERGLQPPLG